MQFSWRSRWGAIAGVVTVVACSSDSGAEPKAMVKKFTLPVTPYCTASYRPMDSSRTGRRGRLASVSVQIALAGTETVTEAADLNVQKQSVGDKSPMRVLLTLDCQAFLVDGEAIGDALKDIKERASCDVTTLNLGALESGKPFSATLKPSIGHDWNIRSLAPDFRAVALGQGVGDDLQISGIHPVQGDANTFDTGRAHLSWIYSVGDGGPLGSWRVELAADCP
jgi:hypothetical protein